MRPKHQWRTRPPQPPDVNEKLVRDEIEILNEELGAQAAKFEVSTTTMISERLELSPRLQLQMGSLEAVSPAGTSTVLIFIIFRIETPTDPDPKDFSPFQLSFANPINYDVHSRDCKSRVL